MKDEAQGKEAQMNNALNYWKDLACANRKVAEDAQAQRDKLADALKELNNAVKEKAYSPDFEHMGPYVIAVDEALKECGK